MIHTQKSLATPGRLGMSAMLVASAFLSTAHAEIPASIDSPQPSGYLIRSTLMENYNNPLGVIDQLGRFETLTGKDSKMMLARSYYEIGDDRCVALLENFIATHPSSPEATEAIMLLGDYHFFNKDFAKALLTYDRLDAKALAGTDASTYSYRKALCHIKTGYYDKAVAPLTRLLNSGYYAPAATFYLAYIDYFNGDTDKAYEGFAKARQMARKAFGEARRGNGKDYAVTGLEAGYYMAQIDFVRGKYEQVISDGQQLISETPVPELVPEIERIVGESYFKLGQNDDAAEYLKQYFDKSSQPTPSALYTMGVISYDRGEYETAAEYFGKLTELDNDLAQSACLYMGQCAVRQGDNDLAAIAFRNAYRMNYDRNVSETAFYNFIAAKTRGGNAPFTSTIDLLREFIDTYPDSRYAPEIEQHMAVAYYNEKDYANALASINRIEQPDAKVLAAKQKILFELGVSEMSNDSPQSAQKHLEEALTLSRFDPKIGAQTALWLGDALYAQRKYSEAQNAYGNYMKNDSRGDNSTLARYNLAYALYMQDKFNEALATYDEALKARPALPPALAIDALMRKADCLYYLGHLDSASDAYRQAIAKGSADADYAAMRNAIIAGVNGDNAAKARMLQQMMQDYPDSKWIATAMLEQALAYAENSDTAKALETFDNLSKRFPDTPETRTALLQMALLYNKNGRREDATDAYKAIIGKWPTSQEASLAGDDLRMIYAAEGNLAELDNFLKGIPGAPQLNSDEVEQLTYEAAATHYATGGDDSKLRNYVEQYPDGRYIAQALRDIAEYEFTELKKPDAALQTIERLIKLRPDAQQIPGALLLKAQIMEQTVPENHRDIVEIYREVEKRGGPSYSIYSWSGIMRNTDSAEERMEYARRLMQAGGVSSEDLEEARFYEAESMLKTGDARKAVEILALLAGSPLSEAGSKAAVTLGQYYVDNRKYEKAIELLTDFTDSGTMHQYWLARGFITLADAYRATGKQQLALEYIRSLRDNYPGDEKDIADMISKRINSWK